MWNKAKSEERVVMVFSKEGRQLSSCSRYRADQMVSRGKAIVIGPDMVQLLLTKQEEKAERLKALKRDNYTCYITEVKLSENQLTVDHIRSRAKGGSDFAENLACCSVEHNQLKGNMDLEDYIILLINRSNTETNLRKRLSERFPEWVNERLYD